VDGGVSICEASYLEEEFLRNYNLVSLTFFPQQKTNNSQGHPQNLKNKIIHGLLFFSGNTNFACVCALSPIRGGWRTGFCGAAGVDHDARAFGTPHCTFAKGFANAPAPSSALFALLFPLPNISSVLMLPNPAFRRASFVPSELNMVFNVCVYNSWEFQRSFCQVMQTLFENETCVDYGCG
jgi:hypothetical protein